MTPRRWPSNVVLSHVPTETAAGGLRVLRHRGLRVLPLNEEYLPLIFQRLTRSRPTTPGPAEPEPDSAPDLDDRRASAG
jgi:hypothetical protein